MYGYWQNEIQASKEKRSFEWKHSLLITENSSFVADATKLVI